MTKAQIKEDLMNIRMYYLDYEFYKGWEDRGVPCIGKELAEKYNIAVSRAPVSAFRVYMGLYCQAMTQEQLAEELGYCPHQIYVWNVQLLQYLQGYFAEQNNCANKVTGKGETA